jgi:hypothetical protein
MMADGKKIPQRNEAIVRSTRAGGVETLLGSWKGYFSLVLVMFVPGQCGTRASE